MMLTRSHREFFEFVLTNSHAFALEEAEFRKFISKLHSLHKTHAGTAVKHGLILTNVNWRERAIKTLGEVNVALKTDLRTTPNNFVFMESLSWREIKSLNPRTSFLALNSITGNHSGTNLANHFYKIVKSYRLNDKVKKSFIIFWNWLATTTVDPA